MLRKIFLLVLLIYELAFALADTTKTRQPLQHASIRLIQFYQVFSKMVPFEMCLFEPSCSHFAVESIDQFGTLKGIQITANRLICCNPGRRIQRENRYLPFGNKFYDPPTEYVARKRTFSPMFIAPGAFQFKNKEVIDGVMALAFTGIPVYALSSSKHKLSMSNAAFLLFGLIFYSGHLNYCYTYPNGN